MGLLRPTASPVVPTVMVVLMVVCTHKFSAAKGLKERVHSRLRFEFNYKSENPNFVILCSSLPCFSVVLALDRLYFRVEGDESFVWVQEWLDFVEYCSRYEAFKLQKW